MTSTYTRDELVNLSLDAFDAGDYAAAARYDEMAAALETRPARRFHYAPVTESAALEALEMDADDARSYAASLRWQDVTANRDAAAADVELANARRGSWSAVALEIDPADIAPRHRDNVRPADSYSLAVDPYRAPRHLDYSAPVRVA